MRICLITTRVWTAVCATAVCGALYASVMPVFGDDDLPMAPEGFAVDVVAREPMVSNPCVMAFDRQGRLLVGQGPQWRGPTPDTPGDRVDLLLDDDNDGIADRRKTFARGFNSIQGLAWHGDDLWIANAPDLTVVRDTDGDDEADQYIRVYTGLGNLEHSLHGLNFGPDGKLYMSKGNSKGYNRRDQLAPKPFRELWGLPSPSGAPDYTQLETYTPETYQRRYHTPQDDWGQQGGILRCDPYRQGELSARNLEIVARGFRNPWDIAFDDGFNWLGTDNDQSAGDRIFMPFVGAHFGWGHPWSFSWTGAEHPPTVPISAATFEGSGTGVAHYHASQFPEPYRDVFFIGDWLQREVLLFRPRWDGALLRADEGAPAVFAHAGGGRTLPLSDGRVFDPTDIEVGPDGCLYVLSWGHQYGGELEKGQQTNAGRVYRFRWAEKRRQSWATGHRHQPPGEWTLEQLFDDLGSHVAAWRVDAQSELLRRRGADAADFLLGKLNKPAMLSRAEQTWTIWTLARMGRLPAKVTSSDPLNVRLQTIRALASQTQRLGPDASTTTRDHAALFARFLRSDQPRLRFAAVQAIGRARLDSLTDRLVDQLSRESDRIVFYATWNVLRELESVQQRLEMMQQARGAARLGLLLGLLADDALSASQVEPLRTDPDSRVAAIATQWLYKTGAAEPLVKLTPEPGEYADSVTVALTTTLPGHRITYTLDGSVPAGTSPSYDRPLTLDRTTTLRVAVLQGNDLAGRIVTAKYRIVPPPAYAGRRFIRDISTPSGRRYEMDYRGLQVGKRIYTDRDYAITALPESLKHVPFLRVANNDDRSQGANWLSFASDVEVDVLVGTDTRNNAPLSWMKIGRDDGFADTQLVIKTNDADFRLYRKRFPAGEIVLGGNTNAATDSGRGNYIVAFERQLLKPATVPATKEQVLAAMATADATRGRELFLHPLGAGCAKCHTMDSSKRLLAPDLSDLGNRAKTPHAVIDSILDPSAVITEGFAQQQILTADGQVVSGAVIEETGRSLTLVGTDGVVKAIDKADIEARRSTKLSPMPAGFDKLMSAQQTADIVAWLMTQKVLGDRAGFSFRDAKDRIDIYWGRQRLATYLKKHPRLTRRALVNVSTLGGIQVTRNFPPRKPQDIDPGYQGEDGIIHPVMHPGIWISFGDVDGNDYWRLQAKAQFAGFTQPPAGDRDAGSFAVRNRLLSEDGQRVVCDETTRYQFSKAPEGWLLRIDAEYLSDDRDFYFGDQEESGLAVRVASPIRVQGGNGAIVNSRGERNGAEVWGKEAEWFDYFGTVEGRQVGVMVVPSPRNPRPSWLHARDYGVVVTNPFPKQPRERREPYVKTWVKKGEPFRLGYAVLIHDLPAEEPLDRKAAAARMRAGLEQ